MRIVVLAKPVPDTTGQERLGPDLRVDRTGRRRPVVNGNDEYALEAALKLARPPGRGGDPAGDGPGERAGDAPQGPRDGRRPGGPRDRSGPRRLRRAGHGPGPRRGAPAASSSTSSSPARTLRRRGRDGGAGDRGAARPALPARTRRGSSRPAGGSGSAGSRRSGYDLIEAPAAGARRRDPGARRAALPVAQGDHGRALEGDRDLVAGRPRDRPGDRRPARPRTGSCEVADARQRGGRPGSSASRRRPPRPRSSPSSPSGGSSDGRADLGRSARSAPTAAWPAISTEVGTLARRLGDGARARGRRAGRGRRTRRPAADELARYLPGVLAVDRARPGRPGRARSGVAAAALGARRPRPGYVLVGRDARTAATSPGMLVGLPRLGGPRERGRRSTWDGRAGRRDEHLRRPAVTRSASPADHGIVTVRPNVVTAEPRRRRPVGPDRVADRRDGRDPARPCGPRAGRRGRRGRPDRGGPDHRRGRPRRRRPGRLPGRRGARRRARWRGRRDPGGRRRRLDPVRPADRPDRQDRQAGALPRPRDLRRDPAQGRDADGRDDRRGQPRPGRADRRVRRPRSSSATCSRSSRSSSRPSGRGSA